MALQGQWKLSGGVWTDTSGNGRTLTKVGTVSQATGFLGGANTAASVSGIAGNSLTLADNAGMSGISAFTICLRLKPANLNAVTVPLVKGGNAAGSKEYALVIVATTGSVSFRVSTDGTNYVILTGATALSAGNWTCLVLDYDGTTMRIFNGDMTTADASGTGASGAVHNSGEQFRLFSNNDASYSNDFVGTIDDVAFYDHVLSQAEREYYKALGEDFVPPPTSATISETLEDATGDIQATLSNSATISETLEDATGTIYADNGGNSATISDTLDDATGDIQASIKNTAAISETLADATGDIEVAVTLTVTEPFFTDLTHPNTGGALTGLGNAAVTLEASLQTGEWLNFTTGAFQTATVAATLLYLDEDVSGNHDGRYQAVPDVTTTTWNGWVTLRRAYSYDSGDGRGTVRYVDEFEVYYVNGTRQSPGLSAEVYFQIMSLPLMNTIAAGLASYFAAIPAGVRTEIDTNSTKLDIQTSQVAAATVTALAADFAAIPTDVRVELTDIPDIRTKLTEIFELYGLDPTKPLVVTDTSRTAGAIVQTVSTTATDSTITRV